jgi:hypothetical protein
VPDTRFAPFSDYELVLIADAFQIAWQPGGIEMGPDADDLPVLFDLVTEMNRRGDDVFGDLGNEPEVEELIRRAARAAAGCGPQDERSRVPTGRAASDARDRP